MKKRLHILSILMFMALLLLAVPVSAAEYTYDWTYDDYEEPDPGPDMSKVSLKAASATSLFLGQDYDSSLTLKLKIKSPDYTFDDSSYYYGSSVESSNKKLYVGWASLKKNVITLQLYPQYGVTDVTSKIKVTMNGKTFPAIKVRVRRVNMNKDSVLLQKGKSTKLSIKCGKKTISKKAAKIKWKSLNPKVASVSKTGKVKGKKNGNAIICATVDGKKVGCVVSVSTKKKISAVKIATRTVKTCKYSQSKRMKKGYYDCSSLVWKSYKSNGCNFGSSSYAPTAADQAKYMARHHKSLGNCTQKKIDKLYYQVGDVAYHIGSPNGRYRNIYHTEMLVGYGFYGFDKKGKAIVWLESLRSMIGPGDPMARP